MQLQKKLKKNLTFLFGFTVVHAFTYFTVSSLFDDCLCFQEPANYQFSYHVQDASSGNDFGHQEKREGHVAKGMYMVLLPDGRRQIVEYTADENGYHPIVRYTSMSTLIRHTVFINRWI